MNRVEEIIKEIEEMNCFDQKEIFDYMNTIPGIGWSIYTKKQISLIMEDFYSNADDNYQAQQINEYLNSTE